METNKHRPHIKDLIEKEVDDRSSRGSSEIRLAKIAGIIIAYIISTVRYYSIGSQYARFGKPRLGARRSESAASAAGLYLSFRESFFSWRRFLAISPRIAETSWRVPFRERLPRPSPPPSLSLFALRNEISRHVEIFLRQVRARCDRTLFILRAARPRFSVRD